MSTQEAINLGEKLIATDKYEIAEALIEAYYEGAKQGVNDYAKLLREVKV